MSNVTISKPGQSVPGLTEEEATQVREFIEKIMDESEAANLSIYQLFTAVLSITGHLLATTIPEEGRMAAAADVAEALFLAATGGGPIPEPARGDA